MFLLLVDYLSCMVTVLDMFCGAGGLSYGFHMAGYTPDASIDVNEKYLQTYEENAPPQTKICNLDLATHSTEEVQSEVGFNSAEIVIGGPPCKGFSLAGNRDKDDERNELVEHFFTHAFKFEPEIIIMENVPGILSMGVLDSVEEKCISEGYTVEYQKLNASHYGVPQSRERVFTVAVDNTSDASFSYPTPTTKENPPTVRDALCNKSELQDLPNHTDTLTNHQQKTVDALAELEFGESRYDNYSESWKRLYPDKPAPTVKENHGAPFVHPFEDRVGTVRECAILQSFPDTFEFIGSKSTQLKTVGNAVPPKLAQAVAEQISLSE